MKFRICTCSKKPEEVLVLTEEEKKFFQDDATGFLKWINKQLEVERRLFSGCINKDVNEDVNLDKIIEHIDELKKIFEEEKKEREMKKR